MPSEDAKSLKKEEIKDEDEETLGSLRKKKPNSSTPKEAKVRKEVAKKIKKEEADEDFEQNPSKKSSNNSSDKVGFWHILLFLGFVSLFICVVFLKFSS